MKNNSKIHDDVVKALSYFVHLDKGYKEVEVGTKANPIIIHCKKDTVEYHPDIWAKTKKKNEVDIYEVWHTEGEREACSDVLHAACVENLRYLGIICVKNPRFNEPWDTTYAKKLVRIFSNWLRNESGESLLSDKVCYAEIGKEELRDEKKMRIALKKRLGF